jgi:hypothetical protein
MPNSGQYGVNDQKFCPDDGQMIKSCFGPLSLEACVVLRLVKVENVKYCHYGTILITNFMLMTKTP